MDLSKFAEELKRLEEEIWKKTETLETSVRQGLDEMPQLLQKLETLLPEWFYFITQTGIGTKEQILLILADMEKAMQAEDSILLGDVLLNGLGLTAAEYAGIIEEALHEE